MLDSLAALIPPDTIEGGRLLSQRGTVLMYLGYTDLATQHFRRLVRLGQELQSRELVARGMVALASRNIVVGNLPNGEREIRRALDYAGREMPRIAAQACNQLGIVRAMRGDPDEGLALLWRAYRLSMRHGTRLTNTNVLGNVVNLLLKNGYPEAARAAAKHMLCTRPGHGDQVNALGRYANASAVLGDVAAVDWSVARLLQLASGSTFPLAIADALYECSLALERVGRLGAAARLRKRAHALAVRHGYHELAYSAGEPPATTPSKISKSTQAIVTEVRALEPDDERLPALVGSGAEGSMDRLHDDGAE
jgi:tetratricopeptide (TPR) repeat protein